MQFLAESLAFSFLSALLGLALYQLLYGEAASMLNTEMPSVLEFPALLWSFIIGAVIVIGVMAGAYPAWYLSKTHTLESLKGKFRSVQGTINFTRGLLAIQFAISIFILTTAVIIKMQINFFLQHDLGFDKNAVLVVTSAPRRWTPEGFDRMETAKRQFLQSPVIAAMSLSTGSPTGQFSMSGGVAYQTGKSITEGLGATITGTDEDYVNVYGMKMLEGVYFGPAGQPARNSIVVNETLKRKLSVGIGDKLKFDTFGDVEYTIVGIVHDFNTTSLRDAVDPVAILHSRDHLTFRHYSIKLKSGNLPDAVQQVERLWRANFPDDAFVYSFADKQIEQLYKTEMQMNKAATLASMLMMVIVMTGVLGLVALTVARRNKEIGIRKVLGASPQNILQLLSREYLAIMLFAFFASVPLSYWFISNWLTSFAYHIDLKASMFALPVFALFTITLVMVYLQGMRAALKDPVKSIRHE
jgi:putative ABC transport system permease protein